MLLVRDVFRLKFGKAREALSMWKDMGERAKSAGMQGDIRILSDLVGPYYTLVMEQTTQDLGTWERDLKKGLGDPAMHELYQKFVPLVESGYREIFTIHQ